MLPSVIRYLATISLVGVLTVTLSAQQSGGTSSGTATGTGTANSGTGAMTSLDPDAVFAAVERGDTAGINTATVGREEDSAAGGTAGRAAGGLGGGGLGGFGGLGGLGSLFGGFNSGATQSTRPAIRTRLRSAITVPPMPPASVQVNATRRFQSLQNRPGLNAINVAMQDRTAVITGVVSSDRDRRMSELLIRLEPGVSAVDNQVVVSPSSPGDRER